jgi:hypothetical protein
MQQRGGAGGECQSLDPSHRRLTRRRRPPAAREPRQARSSASSLCSPTVARKALVGTGSGRSGGPAATWPPDANRADARLRATPTPDDGLRSRSYPPAGRQLRSDADQPDGARAPRPRRLADRSRHASAIAVSHALWAVGSSADAVRRGHRPPSGQTARRSKQERKEEEPAQRNEPGHSSVNSRAGRLPRFCEIALARRSILLHRGSRKELR